jgi:hypothetical protein
VRLVLLVVISLLVSFEVHATKCFPTEEPEIWPLPGADLPVRPFLYVFVNLFRWAEPPRAPPEVSATIDDGAGGAEVELIWSSSHFAVYRIAAKPVRSRFQLEIVAGEHRIAADYKTSPKWQRRTAVSRPMLMLLQGDDRDVNGFVLSPRFPAYRLEFEPLLPRGLPRLLSVVPPSPQLHGGPWPYRPAERDLVAAGCAGDVIPRDGEIYTMSFTGLSEDGSEQLLGTMLISSVPLPELARRRLLPLGVSPGLSAEHVALGLGLGGILALAMVLRSRRRRARG